MKPKQETLYCRMTSEMKERVESEARLRGEAASVVVRDALREYFAARDEGVLQDAPAKPKRRAA